MKMDAKLLKDVRLIRDREGMLLYMLFLYKVAFTMMVKTVKRIYNTHSLCNNYKL